MVSTFSGLDLAYRALQAQQQALDVTNHNIANANTPGYSRETAELSATMPWDVDLATASGSALQAGSGVAVVDVARARDGFLDYQIRNENQTLGRWQKTSAALQQVELVFDEPSDNGLSSRLSKFWAAWQDLANSPQDAGARTALVEQADSLTSAFNSESSQLASIQQNMDTQIKAGVGQINDLADQIAGLNAQIAEVEATGQQANDLRDQRDLALDKLSQFTSVSYFEAGQGGVNVFVGSRALVSGAVATHVAASINGSGLTDITWPSDGSAVSIGDGQLYGLRQVRDVVIPQYQQRLQSLAGQLIASVNALHTQGYAPDGTSGLDFFTGSGASDIAVNTALEANPQEVAAGSTNSPGDNAVALGVAGLRNGLTMDGGNTSFSTYLASTVSMVGTDAQRADTMASNQQLLVDHLNQQKESTSGVSLDEETVRLSEYQRAYEAAARVMTAIDQMLSKLINGTGLVGNSG